MFNLEATHSWVSLIPLDLWRPGSQQRLLSQDDSANNSSGSQKMRERKRGREKWRRQVCSQPPASHPLRFYLLLLKNSRLGIGGPWVTLTPIHFQNTLTTSVNIPVRLKYFQKSLPFPCSSSGTCMRTFASHPDLGQVLFGLNFSRRIIGRKVGARQI